MKCRPVVRYAAEVWGGVLIGGASRRMGYPKHLLLEGDKTWLELIIGCLQEKTAAVAVAGQGRLPSSLAAMQRVADPPGVQGPLAGVLGLLRWRPAASWVIAACDQPAVEPKALDWLLSWREDSVLAVLPDLEGDGLVEPLLAYYDRRCIDLLEELAAAGGRLSDMAGRKGVINPSPPPAIRHCWRNVNSPAERDVLI